MDTIYRALAEENRRKILILLRDKELRVGEIVKEMNLTQATVSNHLAILRKAKLVSFSILGKERIYKLNREVVKIFVEELNRTILGIKQSSNDEIIVRR